jgi:hypothetical protein
MLGCYNQFRETTGAGFIGFRYRLDRQHGRHDGLARLHHRRCNVGRFSLDCDDPPKRHAELLK